MTYRELLELYKKKELDESKMKEIHDEIEKQDAINEYLFEEMDLETFSNEEQAEEHPVSDEMDPSEEKFVSMIQKSIRKAFVKLGIVVAVATLIIVLLVQTVVPKIAALPYYNPAKKIGDGSMMSENQMSLDMAVYTELMIPSMYRDVVNVDNNGWGNYDIVIPQTIYYWQTNPNDLVGTVKKGKLTLYNSTLLKPLSNVFGWYDVTWLDDNLDVSKDVTLTEYIAKEKELLLQDEDFEDEEEIHISHADVGERDTATSFLNDLNDGQYYNCFVTLDERMSYEDFLKWSKKNEKVFYEWCAVQTNGESIGFPVLGFHPDSLKNAGEEWTSEKYPNLVATEVDENDSYDEENTELMQSHFTSMLRYLSDQKQFCKMVDINRDDLTSAADYIDKNGMTIYGFMARMTKEEALEINDIDGVYEISAEILP